VGSQDFLIYAQHQFSAADQEVRLARDGKLNDLQQSTESR
jgi:hypothetical protein